jgi:hypothetical protein
LTQSRNTVESMTAPITRKEVARQDGLQQQRAYARPAHHHFNQESRSAARPPRVKQRNKRVGAAGRGVVKEQPGAAAVAFSGAHIRRLQNFAHAVSHMAQDDR